jgi:hypothetical protein
MLWEKARPRVGLVRPEHTLTEIVLFRPGRMLAKYALMVNTYK